MRSRQVEAFRAIARHGTVTAAAAVLHVSQPAASRLLAHLEAELGFRLFDRQPGRLRLTREGEAFLQAVEQHFVGLDVLQAAGRRIAAHGHGRLRVVAVPSLASGLLAEVAAALLRQHPQLELSLENETSDHVAARVAAGAFDLGVCLGGAAGAEMVARQVLAERGWCLVLPSGHPLAAADVEPVWADLDGLPMVSFALGMSLQAQLAGQFEAVQVRPVAAVFGQSVETVCALAAASGLAAVVHPFADEVVRRFGLSVRRLPGPTLELQAVMSAHRSPPMLVEEVVARLRDALAGTATG